MFQRRLRANRLAKEQAKALKTETMGDGKPRITMGDYCKITDNDQISPGFQPANPANFDIKGNVLTGLRENQFNACSNNDLWDHLAMFSETYQIQKVPDAVIEDQ
jgi:hypothetical protein